MEQQNNSNEMRLCNNCKAFYGTQNTNFLCSKCFKEQQAEETKEAVETSPIKELVKEVAEAVSPKPQLPEKPAIVATEEPKEPQQPVIDPKPVAEADVEMKNEEKKEEMKEEAPKVQTNKSKCWECGRKVGLVQTECKCGYVYCPKHRHAEAHNCTFDYHLQQKTLLEKNNPVIAHQKMQKMF